MFLREIIIKGLFGYDDHHIKLCDGTVTILHGANGEGKTTVLRLVSAVLNGDIRVIAETYFSSIKLIFDEKFYIKVEKEKAYLSPKEMSRFMHFPPINYYTSAGDKFSFTSIPDAAVTFTDEEEKDELNLYRKLVHDFYFQENASIKEERQNFAFNSYLSELKNTLCAKMIDTNRLFVQVAGSRYKTEAIEFYSDDLSKRIKNSRNKKELLSDEKDKTLPFRILKLSENNSKEVTKHSILQKLKEFYEMSKKLEKVGLTVGGDFDRIDEKMLTEKNIDQNLLEFLNLILDDDIQKFECFSPLLLKIELFLKIINKLLSPSEKFMSVSEDGIKFYSTRIPKTEIEPRQIPLSSISSGEKQLFVLFYSLIFMNDGKQNLVLIDEPELSMHISCQEEFINDLLEICEQNSIQAVVSTHSPNIVNGHFDLLVGL